MPTDPFIGEIAVYPYNFAPKHWAYCDGTLLPIAQNTSLFSLLGDTFGGDGRSTFGLPDLRGRVVVGEGTGHGLTPMYRGEAAGAEQEILTTSQMPAHNHTITVQCTATLGATSEYGSTAIPGPDKILAQDQDTTQGVHPVMAYAESNKQNTTLGGIGASAAASCQDTGANQPFPIRNPYLVLSYCIALVGVYPSRS
ncbi:MAG: phage tail protein [Desulfatitalea sp.]|nr:tail fiber protein [Desulfatitalea sp.]NNK01374.1 phage tail protein [Desulfatitalea sp.]